MGLRETLNENPRITTIGTVVVILIFIGAIVYSMQGPAGATSRDVTGLKAFFTDDDGVTTFKDDLLKVAPFDHNGKQAVRAHVYSAGGKQFVGHLERYTPEWKPKMEKIYAEKKEMNDPTVMGPAQMQGMEVKLPGQKDWVKRSDPKANEIMQPKPPAGVNADDMVEVKP